MRRAPLQRRPPPFRKAAIYVIAVEGETDEPWYFNGLMDRGHIAQPRRVVLDVIPAEEGKSSPDHVVERLDARWREREWREQDEFWLVVDIDKWGKKLHEALREAEASGWHTAVSAPCFETWLQFHFTDEPAGDSSKSCKKAWKRLRDTAEDAEWPFTTESVRAAIDRAQERDTGTHWPPEDRPGSHVHRLVRTLPDP